jgi:hypothetical protein
MYFRKLDSVKFHGDSPCSENFVTGENEGATTEDFFDTRC